jgi:hypothetical protein
MTIRRKVILLEANTSPNMALCFLEHARPLGDESIASRKVDGAHQSGRCRSGSSVRNPASIAVQRERSENWNR